MLNAIPATAPSQPLRHPSYCAIPVSRSKDSEDDSIRVFVFNLKLERKRDLSLSVQPTKVQFFRVDTISQKFKRMGSVFYSNL